MREGKPPLKTIGVLGGIGPQATMDFEARVHAISQRLIEPEGNRGYPPLIVYYHRRLSVIVGEDGEPVDTDSYDGGSPAKLMIRERVLFERFF